MPQTPSTTENPITALRSSSTVDASAQATPGIAPDRSPSQRMEALRLANAVRTERAKLKRDIRAGKVRVDQIIADPPACADTAKVVDLLLAMPRYGRVKVAKVLNECRISPSKTVAGISHRQRADLITALRRF